MAFGMNTSGTSNPPTLPQLWKGVGIALSIAGTVLLIAVLPAEYGIDPTGIGRRIGLEKRPAIALSVPEPPVPVPTATGSNTPSMPADAVSKSNETFRSDEMSLTLRPGEGAEIKALMQKGKQFVFSWSAQGGTLEFDMHGEPINARANEFTSYWKGENATSGHGTFTSSFDGTHGWYWRNGQSRPVTVTLKISGFYEKLYRPQGSK